MLYLHHQLVPLEAIKLVNCIWNWSIGESS